MWRCARGGFRPLESEFAVEKCPCFQLNLKKRTQQIREDRFTFLIHHFPYFMTANRRPRGAKNGPGGPGTGFCNPGGGF